MFLNRIIPFLSFLCNIVSAYAQQYPVSDIPKELLSRANAVVREERISFDLDDSNLSQTTYKAITVLNQAGDKYAELVLYYDKSKTIKDIKGQIFDEFGKQTSKFNEKNFKDYSATSQVSMFDDIRVKHYAPAPYNYPYTIVYSYEVKHSQNLFIPYWRPNYFPDVAVAHSLYQLTCKHDQSVRIKAENISNAVKLAEMEKSKTYTWEVKNIQARKEEPFKPIADPEIICVKAVPETFHYFKKRGTVNNWSDFGKWVYDNLLAGKQDISSETKNKVRELTGHLNSQREKAEALYEYLQNKTRYVSVQIGIGGLEPYPASYVERLGYGDCKALVNYMQALLSEAGIQSLYCIVEAGKQKESLDIDFANAVDGNHIILCLPLENDTTWIECTSNKHPFGYIGNFTDDRMVLACTPEGGKILRTTPYPSSDNIQSRIGHLTITKNGDVEGAITTRFAGTQFDNHFENISKGQGEQHTLLKRYYDVDNISFSNNRYEVEKKPESAVIEKTDIILKKYAVKSNGQLIFHPNIFNIAKAVPESKNRMSPLYINRGYIDVDSITFNLQEDVKNKFHPIHSVVNSPMGDYELHITMHGNKILFFRKLEIREGTYPAESYSQFYDFMRKVSGADRGKFTLTLAVD